MKEIAKAHPRTWIPAMKIDSSPVIAGDYAIFINKRGESLILAADGSVVCNSPSASVRDWLEQPVRPPSRKQRVLRTRANSLDKILADLERVQNIINNL